LGKQQCFQCKKEIGSFSIRSYSPTDLKDSNKQIPEGMKEKDKICSQCFDSLTSPYEKGTIEKIMVKETTGENLKKEKPTRLLYLVPITMGILGGVLMYIAVKDQNQEMANDGMFWGVVVTIIGILFYGGIMYLGLIDMSRIMTMP